MSEEHQLPPGASSKQSKATSHIPPGNNASTADIPLMPRSNRAMDHSAEHEKLYGQEKSVYSKFIETLEKNDPTGFSKAYYTTLVGKYEKTIASEGLYEADKKALEYIKKNDSTGFMKWYYEETRLGKIEIDLVKTLDDKSNKIDRVFDGGIKAIIKDAKEVLHDLQGITTPSKNNDHNNKNLPGKLKQFIQID